MGERVRIRSACYEHVGGDGLYGDDDGDSDEGEVYDSEDDMEEESEEEEEEEEESPEGIDDEAMEDDSGSKKKKKKKRKKSSKQDEEENEEGELVGSINLLYASAVMRVIYVYVSKMYMFTNSIVCDAEFIFHAYG